HLIVTAHTRLHNADDHAVPLSQFDRTYHDHSTSELVQIGQETGGDHELDARERTRDAQQAVETKIENFAKKAGNGGMPAILETPVRRDQCSQRIPPPNRHEIERYQSEIDGSKTRNPPHGYPPVAAL